MDKVTDFVIKTRPYAIEFECPHCEQEVIVDWRDLDVPEYWGDNWGETECPRCGKTVSLGDYDMD